MAGQDEEDYKFYGTPIEDEEETRAGQRRKEARDPAATRALPLHKQEATDEQGRRRFHGAFTGGFSAGYFNTVGSKEGWQPASFRSSRDERAAVQQSVEQYLDDDELEELRRTNLQTTAEYDTFGSTAAELARRAAADAAAERRSAIPSLMPDEMVVPVAESVGIRLLQRMGWRQGKGIGGGGDTPTAADEEAEQAAGGGGGGGEGRRRRWGQHASVAAENTPLHLLAPKTDLHGLGYDPFKGAEDFRRIKEQRRAADAPGQAAKKRRRGIAFGSGVLDEEDGYGEGTTMEDYVTHDDLGDYDGEVEAGGMPRSRAPKLRKSGLGDRLARKGYSFEIVDEEDEGPELLEWHQAKRQPQLALAGREAPLLLQSKEHSHGKGGLVPGFVRATATVVLAFFPPPRLPPGYVPVHRPSQAADEALPAAAARFAPPQADPPADAELRQAIDSLAFFVARNGIVFENMARQRQQKEGRWAFLSGGEGAAYYRWKMHSLQAIISPQQQQRRRAPPLLAIGQRPAPLSADERGALLGEAPLAGAAPATAGAALSGWATGAAEGQRAAAAAIAEGRQQEALRRQLLQVSQADRQRLQQLLSRNFVAAESSEMLQPAAAPGRVVTERDLARPAEGGDLALRPGGGLGPGDAARAAAARRPVRRSEEWRPLPLLCKRFNVPDPYHGRPAELQMSRFKTDHLALPETAAAVAASLAAAPAGAQDFLLPPSVAAAIKEAEAQQALALGAGGGSTAAAAAPAAAAGPPQQQQPEDAAGAADAFLSSLSDMLGGGGGGAGAAQGEPAPPLPPGPPPPGDTGAAGDAEAAHVVAEAEAAERPVDLFKAIFEDSEEEEEEEEEEGAADATAHEQQGQQHPQGAQAPGSASGAAVEQQRGGPAVPADEGAAAQQAQRPQHTFQPPAAQQQRPAEDAAFGFAKLRAPTAALPPASAAAAAAIAAGGLDDATKQRVQEALRALRKDKKEKKGSKKKSKKEKKEKSKKSRHKGKRKKQRRRSDSSESSSESDSD